MSPCPCATACCSTRTSIGPRPRGAIPSFCSARRITRDGGNALVNTDTLGAVEHGYAVVIQDVRGRFHSDGDFTPFHQEIDDGYDTVEWCAAQPWSDGNVGMYGTSYVGARPVARRDFDRRQA